LRVVLQGGGVFVLTGTVSIVNSQVYSNQASFVRAHAQNPQCPHVVKRFSCQPSTEVTTVTSRSLRRGPTSVSIAAVEQPSAPGQRSSLASQVAQSQLAQPAQSQLARHRRPRRRRRPRRPRRRPLNRRLQHHHPRLRPRTRRRRRPRRPRLPRRRPLRRHHLHPRHPTSPSSPQLPPAWSPRPSPLSALR